MNHFWVLEIYAVMNVGEKPNCPFFSEMKNTPINLALQSRLSNCAPSNCARLPNCALFQGNLRDCQIVHVFSDRCFCKRPSNCAHFLGQCFTKRL